MKNRTFTIIFFTLLFLILFAPEASAQNKKITNLDINEPAPFAGILLTPEAFAELKVSAELKVEEIALHVNFGVKQGLLEKELEIDNLKTTLKWAEKVSADRLVLRDQQISNLYKSLEKEKKVTIWKRLKGPTNFAGGIALTLAILYIQSQVWNNPREIQP